MNRRATCAAVAALLLAAPAAWATALDFSVLLDGKPIGEHRFRIEGTDDRTVTSEADFRVTLLGLTVYRYRHRAQEQWRGGCLQQLTATTDDDGTASQVQAHLRGGALEVSTGARTESLPGCVMSFAYWSPAIRTQSRLLNTQTGAYEAVQIRRTGNGEVQVRGQTLAAERWRIEGPEQPIDLWYLPGGEWVGLDSVVGGGRQLSYRLR